MAEPVRVVLAEDSVLFREGLARLLTDQLEATAPGVAVLVPMDGFHFTNRRLEELSLRGRKGATETFDVEGYIRLLNRARDASQETFSPIYDRQSAAAV